MWCWSSSENGPFHARGGGADGGAFRQVLWAAKRDAKLLRERQQRSASELDGCTFAPVVNKTRPSTAGASMSVTAEEAIKAARAAAKAGRAEHAVKEGDHGDVGQRLYEQAQEKARRLEAKRRARQEERDREESALVAAAVRPASPYKHKRPQSAAAAAQRSSSGSGGGGGGAGGGAGVGDGYLVRRRGVPYRGQGMDECTFRPHVNLTPKFKTTPSRWRKAPREATPEPARTFKDEAPFEASELLRLPPAAPDGNLTLP